MAGAPLPPPCDPRLTALARIIARLRGVVA